MGTDGTRYCTSMHISHSILVLVQLVSLSNNPFPQAHNSSAAMSRSTHRNIHPHPHPHLEREKTPEDSSPAAKWTTQNLPDLLRVFQKPSGEFPCLCPVWNLLRAAMRHYAPYYYITVALGFSTGNSLNQSTYFVFLMIISSLSWYSECRDDQMTGVP